MSDTIQRAAADQIDKHKRLLRTGRDGRLLSALMLPLLRWAPPAGYGVLTTTGRKTGKPRRKCVRVIKRDGHAYLVALRPPHLALQHPTATQDWVWNVRANPAVRLRLPGGTFDGVAHEITQAGQLEQSRAAICNPVHLGDYGECLLHLRGLPSRAKSESCTTTGSRPEFRS
jgi:deazaflavin-dependent oxidoreductase (nitroreductase family)